MSQNLNMVNLNQAQEEISVYSSKKTNALEATNTFGSEYSSNYNPNESFRSQSKDATVLSKRDSLRKNTESSSTVGTKKKRGKKKSKKHKVNKSQSLPQDGEEDLGGAQNQQQLEPIMEAPPLTQIVQQPNIYEFYINQGDKNTEELHFKDNKICTTKYNLITFLPKALFYQFIRLANVYFVFIAVIQSIPIISPLGAATAIAPLVFVFAVSLIREAIEDIQRARLDKEQNSDLIDVYRDNQWVTVESGELKMGEIIKVKKDGIFPADLLLIDSNLPDGICFIETGTLDGEKTLKIKNAPNFTKGKFKNAFGNVGEGGLNRVRRLRIGGGAGLSSSINQSQSQSEYLSINRKSGRSDMPLPVSLENNENNNGNSNNIGAFILEGIIQCDLPNPSLYMLNGKSNMRLNGIGNEFGLDAKNLLLKGAKLKNTEWIIGIIIYTGHNCKMMKNAKDPILKMSSVESLLNKLLVGILIVQIILSITSAILHKHYFTKDKASIIQDNENFTDEEANTGEWIDFMEKKMGLDSFISFFTYILLLNTLIPVSLVITLEIVKIIQGLFISADCEGYSFNRKKFITTNSVSLNEELGTIDYIFSDKTGTLTCNKMNLKFCVIGQQCFEYIRNGLGSEEMKINKKLRDKEDIIPCQDYDMMKNSSIKKSKLSSSTIEGENGFFPVIKYQNYEIKSKAKKNTCIYLDSSEKLIEEYWKALSLCHDCSIQNGEYIGMSPDNLELVKSAKMQGFKFDVSGNNTQFLVTYETGQNNSENLPNEQQRFEKLKQIEFSSDRKRESVLVKEGSLYKLYIKGADSIIEERLDNSTPPQVLERARYFVNLFSAQGYRTLFIAMKILSEEEADDFLSECEQAEMDTQHKKEKLEAAYATVEKDLTLMGATIVEDKLQENVPEVIKELRQADIKIWMLTGDKLSTAYNIGLSCNLINKEIKTFFVEGVEKQFDQDLKLINKEQREAVIINFVKEYQHFIGDSENGHMENKKKFGILVDEKALLTITENEEIAQMFLNVAKDAVAVICCRVSPLQKSQVVKLMKNFDKSKITLAIGDGGNDVSMIMEAHIGIGIYGEEGLRAAQSSDYAIGEFQVLRRLLFFHGYLNLMRNSSMVIYFFYKNFVFTIIHYFFGFWTGFSGQTIIDDWFITLYNLVFTSIPLAARGILDVSFRPDDGKIVLWLLPYLYKENRDFPIFNVKKIVLNLFKGVIHALINYFITIYSMNLNFHKDGYESNLWLISVVLYTNILLLVTFDMVVFTRFHTIVNWLVIVFLTFVLYIIFLVMVERMMMFNSVATMHVSFNAASLWMNLILVSAFCFVIDFIILSFETLFVTSIHAKLKLVKDKDDVSQENLDKLPSLLKGLIMEKFEGGVILNNNAEGGGSSHPRKGTSGKKSRRKSKVQDKDKVSSAELVGVDNVRIANKQSMIASPSNKESENNYGSPVVIPVGDVVNNEYENIEGPSPAATPMTKKKKIKKKKKKKVKKKEEESKTSGVLEGFSLNANNGQNEEVIGSPISGQKPFGSIHFEGSGEPVIDGAENNKSRQRHKSKAGKGVKDNTERGLLQGKMS